MTTIGILTTAAPGANSLWASISSFLPIIAIFVVFYFLLILPQKKKAKAEEKMRSELEVGDEVITTGGIIGMVVSVKEDNVVIETGTERSKIRLLKGAIASNSTARERNTK